MAIKIRSLSLLLVFGLGFMLHWLTRKQVLAHSPDGTQAPFGMQATRQSLMDQPVADARGSAGDSSSPLSVVPCENGFAGIYACWNADLMAFMPLSTFGAGSANDIWGWTDPLDQREYALLGLNIGTAFVDITDAESPVYVGLLPTHTINSPWRDIKVYDNYAFIVSEASLHGMQVFDLTRLRNVIAPPVTFSEDNHYDEFSYAHNIAINEDTGYAYVLGSNLCAGGLHMVNIQNPLNPSFAGCFSDEGPTHDSQCVLYHGPDADYLEQEICFNANGDTLTIVDVTNKAAPLAVSITPYPGSGFTHQGWLTEDHAYFLLGDETDEISLDHSTRTRIWDVTDLDAPTIIGIHDGPNPSSDHNLYVRDNFVFESNYTSGLQIYDLCDVSSGNLTLDAYFDTYPANNNTGFFGSWSNYPFFASEIVPVSGIDEGLFILRPLLPGVSLSPMASYLSGMSGEVISHTFTLTNTGTISDIFAFSVDGNDWNTNLSADSTGLLAPGEIFKVTVSVTIPIIATTTSVDSDQFTMTASSASKPCVTVESIGTTNANVDPGMVLTPAYQMQTGFPGETVFHNLTITNTGDYTDTFTYAIDAIWPTSVQTATASALAPGQTATLQIGVHLPAYFDGTIATTDIFTLAANSQWDMTITRQASGTTNAIPNPMVALSPGQTRMGSVGSNVIHTLIVTNTGGFPDTFMIDVKGVWPAIASTPGTGPLTFGQSYAFTVIVSIPSGAMVGESDITTVTVTSTLDNAVVASAKIATVVAHQIFFPIVARGE